MSMRIRLDVDEHLRVHTVRVETAMAASLMLSWFAAHDPKALPWVIKSIVVGRW